MSIRSFSPEQQNEPFSLPFDRPSNLPARLVDLALYCAENSGTSLDHFLLRNSIVAPEILYRAFAHVLEVPFTMGPLNIDPNFEAQAVINAEICPLAGNRLHPRFGMAPTGQNFFGLLRLASLGLLRLNENDIVITTPQNFVDSVRRCFGKAIARRSINRLQDTTPYLSARSLIGGSRRTLHSVVLGACLLMLITSPFLRRAFILTLTFFPSLPSIFLKARALSNALTPMATRKMADCDLPTYTIMIPLYRERRILSNLIKRLERIDYPKAKLDIKILIEMDDIETRLGLISFELSPVFDIVVCPLIGPRTKPKALMIGLAYARGDFVVVFDAEDDPEPDQLRKAVETFRQGHHNLGCVQARLAIDNSADSWISRMFAIEYAALFDALLPGMAQTAQPIPLGGTSNHFRRSTLQACLAWDPWNVTEDADLGLRMARLGYQTDVIDSTTWEEAPNTFKAWHHQRTRWLKGWIQTLLVLAHPIHHGPSPISRSMQLKIATIGVASVTSAMFHPVVFVIIAGWMDRPWPDRVSSIGALLQSIIVITSLAGYAATSSIAIWRGTRHRGLKLFWYDSFGLILYSLMKCLAAWRAVGEFLIAPSHWRKTDHGKARTSRRNPA
jgi:glycosyltransferase XagB